MKPRINILFVMLQMKPGGSEKLVYEIISGLDRERFSPSVAWFKDKDLVEDFKKLNIQLHYIPKTKRLDLHAMAELSKVIKTTGAKIVNVHHFMPLFYSYFGCKVANNVKIVYTEHSLWEVRTDSLMWALIKGYMLKKTDAVIGVSEEISNSIKKTYKLKEKQVYAIRNGVNLRKYPQKHDRLIQGLGINENPIKIVMVANFRKNKNHVFLLKAFSELSKRNNNKVHLVFIGQGFKDDPDNSESEVLETIRNLNLNEKVSLLGYRSNVNELLSEMDIACLCSDKEGLPMSLIEAMAAGLPVVGTDVDGIKDVIIDKYNGFLVEKGDVKKYSEALDILVQDRDLRMIFGRRSQEIVAQEYSMEKCIFEYEEVFVNLLDSHC